MKNCLFIIFSSLLFIPGEVLCETAPAVPRSSSLSIVKVVRQELKSADLGRSGSDLGVRLKTFDKFYSSQSASSGFVGEAYIVEWSCSGLVGPGETVRLHFEYRTEGDSAVKTKDVDVFVDRNGLYETALEHRDEEFAREGRIESWKIVLLRGDRILDQETSNLWAE